MGRGHLRPPSWDERRGRAAAPGCGVALDDFPKGLAGRIEVHETGGELHVLLRHRPRSIPRAAQMMGCPSEGQARPEPWLRFRHEDQGPTQNGMGPKRSSRNLIPEVSRSTIQSWRRGFRRAEAVVRRLGLQAACAPAAVADSPARSRSRPVRAVREQRSAADPPHCRPFPGDATASVSSRSVSGRGWSTGKWRELFVIVYRRSSVASCSRTDSPPNGR